jgi:hypothetical protein
VLETEDSRRIGILRRSASKVGALPLSYSPDDLETAAERT